MDTKTNNKQTQTFYISPFHISIVETAPVGVIFLPACAQPALAGVRPKSYA
ncbi:MAG TPA: hypothetical protein VJH06_02545 [Candidatus Paceibacterota bacterium]